MAAAALVMTTAPAISATALPAPATVPAPDMPAEVLAKYREIYADVPVEVLYQRLDLMLPRKLMLREFTNEHATTFGGSWYDFRTGEWHLLSTSPAALDAMAGRARAAGIAARPRVVRYSHAQLHARALRIRSGQDALSKISRHAGIDIEANRVKVRVAAGRPTVADPMVRYVDPPRVQHGPLQACSNRRDCGVPMRSGIILWGTHYDNPQCSLGFVARSPDGAYWALTAGHCTKSTTQMWGHGQQSIGVMRDCGRPWQDEDIEDTVCRQNFLGVDAARIRISNAYWLQSTFGYIFHTPSAYVNVDAAVSNRLDIEVNEVVCLSGWHSNYTGFATNTVKGEVSPETCGNITDPSEPKYGMVQVGSGASPCGGDSGGGWVYYPGGGQRWAYGLHRNASNPEDANEPTFCGDGRQAWFSALPDVNLFFDQAASLPVRVVSR